MNRSQKQSGFSLTEMLIATGIMAIGLVMVATVFPVGVKLTSLASERAIGAVVADEAFAKIQLYGMRDFVLWPPARMANPEDPFKTAVTCSQYRNTTGYAGPDGTYWTADDHRMGRGADGNWGTDDDVDWDSEFVYPSTALQLPDKAMYHWSALCRRVGPKDIQVTVFVNRKTSVQDNFCAWKFDEDSFDADLNNPWPTPVLVSVALGTEANELKVDSSDSPNHDWVTRPPADPHRVLRFFSEGVTIVDDATGRIYRVMEYKDTDNEGGGGYGLRDTLVLDKAWQPNVAAGQPEYIWVVPPARGSSRYPCVGVYQKVLYFENIQ